MTAAPVPVPTAIETIEAAIVAHLKGKLGPAPRIEPFPDNPAAFDLASTERAVLVHYTGSRFEAAEGVGGGAQVRRPGFAVHVYVRSLRGEGGGYRLLEDVRLALQAVPATGDPAAGQGLAIVRDELAEQDGGLWHWLLEVRALVRSVPRRPVAPAPMVTGFQRGTP